MAQEPGHALPEMRSSRDLIPVSMLRGAISYIVNSGSFYVLYPNPSYTHSQKKRDMVLFEY